MVFPYLETAVSFALVMLVASLMVNVTVRVLYTLRGQRAQGVSDMLLQLHRGFSDERDIVLVGAARKRAEQAFLDDVLGSPILHNGRRWAAADVLYERGMTAAAAAWVKAGLAGAKTKEILLADAKTSAAAQAALALEDKAAADRVAYLAARVEYIKRGDLLAIIRTYSIDAGIDDARHVPISWFGGVMTVDRPPTRAQQRQFAYHANVPPGTVNARDFHDYCLRWFPTVEDNASTAFGDEQRKIARSIAGLAVVLLNLDAIHLAYDLYRDRAVSEQLTSRVSEVLALAKQVDTDGHPIGPNAPNGMAQASQELGKAAAILSVEHVPIGWHDSYIAKRWCAYHDDCDDTTIKKPTRGALMLDIMMWILGLATSWMLLSLGAPFWVRMIERITGLANLGSGSAVDDHKGEERAWYVEGGGNETSYDPAASSVGLPRQQPITGEIAPDAATGTSGTDTSSG